jgi:hypothetical protein
MTTTNFVNPTYYSIQKAVIRSEYSNIGELDITALIPRLSISVSIDSETIFGSARIVDSVGLLDGSKTRDSLRGEEQIILEIADSNSINKNGGAESGKIENPFRFVGFVYKVDNIETKDVNDAVTYDIHFISYQSFKAGTYSIIRAFIDKTVSDIIKTIFKEYYEQPRDLKEIINPSDRKRLFIEDTEGVYRCTIPKMRPEEAMGFLTKRSYSTRSPSCMFRFFENTRGYHYVTDEQLYRLATDEAEPDYDPSRLFRFTYLDAIPNTLEFFDRQLNNLDTIENSKRVNSLDDIYNGAYRNKVYEIDILSRNLNLLDDTNQYDYFKRREKYNLRSIPEFNKLADRHTKNFIETIHRGSEDVQKKWLVIQNYTDGEKAGENSMQAQTYYAEIISNRAAYSKHLENITVNARGPGRLDITAGDIVDLKVEDFTFANPGNFETNKHLSGKYIVRSVTHSMEYEEMFNSYVLVKREWAQTEMDIESTRIFTGGR